MPCKTRSILSKLAEMAELFLHFPQDGVGQSAKSADEPLVVDRAALIDHDFTLLTVSGDPFWERYA